MKKTFEYFCFNCRKSVILERRIHVKHPKCPKCGKNELQPRFVTPKQERAYRLVSPLHGGRGMSRKEAAKIMGVSPQTISELLNTMEEAVPQMFPIPKPFQFKVWQLITSFNLTPLEISKMLDISVRAVREAWNRAIKCPGMPSGSDFGRPEKTGWKYSYEMAESIKKHKIAPRNIKKISRGSKQADDELERLLGPIEADEDEDDAAAKKREEERKEAEADKKEAAEQAEKDRKIDEKMHERWKPFWEWFLNPETNLPEESVNLDAADVIDIAEKLKSSDFDDLLVESGDDLLKDGENS